MLKTNDVYIIEFYHLLQSSYEPGELCVKKVWVRHYAFF